MSRTLAVPALLLLTLLPGAARAEDEPTFETKKLSEWLEMLQKDPKADRRRGALIAIELIGPKKSRKVVPAVLTALRDDAEERVREGAAAALGRIGSKALKDKPEDFKFDSVRDALAVALRGDKSGRVREASATALGKLEFEARGAVGALAAALKDMHPGTRAAAGDSLRRLGNLAHEALSEIQQVMQDRTADRATRVQCARAIGRIGAPDALPALSALKEVLADAKAPAEVRKAVAETLGDLGNHSADAAPVLGQVLTLAGNDTAVRRAAAAALDAIGPDGRAALPALVKALKDEDKFVRCHSMHAVGRYGKDLGPDAKAVVAGLLVCLDDTVLDVRLAAVETLGSLGADGLGDDAKAVTDRLEDATRDSQKAVADAAVAALKKIKGMP